MPRSCRPGVSPRSTPTLNPAPDAHTIRPRRIAKMREQKRGVLALGLVAVLPASLLAQPSDAQVKARVDALLSQMTLEEKVGQLTQAGGIAFGGAPGPEEALRKGAGSVLWVNDTKRFNALQKIAVEESRLKIPLLFGLDVIHGYRTIFPIPIGDGGVLGSRGPRARGRGGGEGSPRRRHPLDVRTDGGHRPRRPLGPDRRGRRRGPVPRRGHGGGSGARLPGAVPGRARPAARVRQALRRLRRGGRRARLRPRLRVRGAAAQRLLPALRRRGQGGRGLVHERPTWT